MLLFNENQCISICLNNTNPYVKLAVEDLRNDFRRVNRAGLCPQLLEQETDYAIIIEENQLSDNDPVANESFAIRTEGTKIRIMADGYLGTMWGIYTFSRQVLGVDPCYLFNDLEIEKKAELYFTETEIMEETDGFTFRGIFINDEDFLTGWKGSAGMRFLAEPWYKMVLPAEIMDMVVETALRLKFNLIIPATHLDIENPPEKALADAVAKRGIYLSQHHIEPLGVSSFTFEEYLRKHKRVGKYSYFDNPELFHEIWRHYAKAWAQYDNVVWQIGLRGISDRPVWQEANPTEEELAAYGQLISRAYETQKQIVQDATHGRAKHFTVTLWMEGAGLMKKGYLRVPEGAVTVFADTGPSQTYSEDFHTYPFVQDQKYGIYYHLQYFCCGPHLVPQTGLNKLYYHTKLAYEKGCRDYYIMNASNIREFVFELDAYAQMTKNIHAYTNEQYLNDYCSQFGDGAQSVKALVGQYYDALPELDVNLLAYQHANYFHFSMEKLPAPLKTFIAKDGLIIELMKHLVTDRGFYIPFPDPRFEAVSAELKNRLPQYEQLHTELTDLAETLPANLKKHIEMKWLLFTDTLIYLYRSYLYLYTAKCHYDVWDGENAEKYLILARETVMQYLTYRKCAEYGEFANWYRGDIKMNVKHLLVRLDYLLGRTPEMQ